MIVVIGVWLAIVVGNRTEEAQQRARANETLRSIVRELRQDEADIRSILANSRHNTGVLHRIATESRKPVIADSVLGDLIARQLQPNLTFFPRRAAYPIMVNAGQLQDVTSGRLRLRIAELYDHHYVRVINAGDLADEISFAFRFGLLEFWDYELRRAVPSAAATMKISNLAHRYIAYNAFYRNLLETQLLRVTETQRAIASYLKEDG